MLAVGVDVDGTALYERIHGLEGSPAPAGGPSSSLDPAWALGVPRARAWAEALGVPLSFFVVAADLASARAAEIARAAHDAGHALENHTLSHPYDLVRLPRRAQLLEVERAATALRVLSGRAPEVFRAPGYTTSPELFSVLEELGVAFDSSIFPAPAYWLAKAAAMGAYALRGRPSGAILGSPRALVAPTRPHRIGRVFELPIQVLPGARLPLIGTSLALLGPGPSRLAARALVREPLVNLELHALDFLDAREVEALAAREPALRVPLARRLEAFGAFVEAARAGGHAAVRLDEAGRALARAS